MTLLVTEIQPTLHQLSNIYSQCKKDIDDPFIFNVALSQELRNDPPPIPQSLEPYNKNQMSFQADRLHHTPTVHLVQEAAPETTQQVRDEMIEDTYNRISGAHNIKLGDLKESLQPYLVQLRDVLSTFHDYKNNDDDPALDVKLCAQFNVSKKEANNLKILCLLLAEEVYHDPELCLALLPDDKQPEEFNPSEVLYFLSEHFYMIGKGNSRRNKVYVTKNT